MNELDRQLKRVFAAAKPARLARINAEAPAPIGFAGRVANRWQASAGLEDGTGSWANISRWGLGLACAVLVFSLVLNRNLLSADWSPALNAAEHVAELVSLP